MGKEKCLISNISDTWFLYGSLFTAKTYKQPSHGSCVSALVINEMRHYSNKAGNPQLGHMLIVTPPLKVVN